MIGRTVRWLKNHKAVLAVLVLALLALLSLEGFRYVRAFEDLRDGKDLLATAADRLDKRGLDVTSGELDESEEEFIRAQDRIDSASGVLDSDPVLTVVSWLPWIGTQVDAARDLADIGVQSADLGAGTVDAMREFQRIRDTQGGDNRRWPPRPFELGARPAGRPHNRPRDPSDGLPQRLPDGSQGARLRWPADLPGARP